MRGLKHYILEGRNIVEVDSLEEWVCRLIDRPPEADKVAETLVGEMRISTVFLMIDHNHFGKGPPILFETMVFGGTLDETCIRSGTYDEAVDNHAIVVQEAQEIQAQLDKLILIATNIDLDLQRGSGIAAPEARNTNAVKT